VLMACQLSKSVSTNGSDVLNANGYHAPLGPREDPRMFAAPWWPREAARESKTSFCSAGEGHQARGTLGVLREAARWP
jgi:hypothetical protein